MFSKVGETGRLGGGIREVRGIVRIYYILTFTGRLTGAWVSNS